MALKQTIQFSGVPVVDAYIKVENATVDAVSMTAMVVWRASAGNVPLRNKLFSLPYVLDGGNPLAQAYAALKTIDEFAGAVDA